MNEEIADTRSKEGNGDGELPVAVAVAVHNETG
jgi:hypothetical protein